MTLSLMSCQFYIIMPKIKERDEQEALKLDEDFKQILMRMRPYILNLRSTDEAYLCKIWLDKLNCTISQRNLRNRYLVELFQQLKTGTLGGIFKTQPPSDLLMPLSSSCRTSIRTSSSLSKFSVCARRQNCLTPSESSEQTNNLQNTIYNSESSTSIYIHRRNDTVRRNDLKLCDYRIEMLTIALENLRLQNERLKQELMKYQGQNTDNEAFRRNCIKQLKAKAQSQSLEGKVKALKRTIAKLKKLNKIVEHIYEKKLQRIVRNKNLEIKILQLQYQGQTSELCLSLCSEKQNEVHSLVKSLEEKYKALLAIADTDIKKQQQEYLTKIAMLEYELCHLKKNRESNSKYT